MKENQTKIGVNQMKKIINIFKKEASSVTYEDVSVRVKPCLSFEEYCKFILEAVDLCFSEDGKYHPYLKKFAWGYCVLYYYTNIRITENPSQIWEYIAHTDVIRQVEERVSDPLNEMRAVIEESIQTKLAEESVEKAGYLHAIENTLSNLSESMQGVDARALLETAQKLADKDERKIAESVLDLQAAQRTKESK